MGGGPGGLVSALYLRRFRRKVLLVNAGKPRAAWIPRTHNLIGYENGIAGKDLLARLQRQVLRLGIDVARTTARVKRRGEGFEIALEGEERGRVTARKVILATGIRDVEPEIPNLIDLRKRGLLRYCSICDGYEYRDQPIAVLAADDMGLQKALFLRNWTRKIRVIVPEDIQIAPVRRRELDEARVRITHCRTIEMEPDGIRKGLDISLDGLKPFYARAAYVELGCEVTDTAFAGLKGLFRTKEGFLTTTQEQRTTVPGLFAVGDCVNLLGQIMVAAGQAAVATTTIHNDLLE